MGLSSGDWDTAVFVGSNPTVVNKDEEQLVPSFLVTEDAEEGMGKGRRSSGAPHSRRESLRFRFAILCTSTILVTHQSSE